MKSTRPNSRMFQSKLALPLVSRLSRYLLLGLILSSAIVDRVNAATVNRLNQTSTTASGAGSAGIPNVSNFNIPSGKNRVLFIWVAFERDHCAATDNCTNANTAGTGLGDNWPVMPYSSTPQLTARVIGSNATINKKNALTVGGTPSGDLRFHQISTSPQGSPTGTAYMSISSYHIALYENEINQLLGGAASGSVSISLPDVFAPLSAGDEAYIVASVYENVEQSDIGIVRNAVATAQTSGTPATLAGNYSLNVSAYDANQVPNENDDGQVVMGISSTTEGFITPGGFTLFASQSNPNSGGIFDTTTLQPDLSPVYNVNEPSGSSIVGLFRNNNGTGAGYSLQSAAASTTPVWGGISQSFLLESDSADIADAPVSYGSPTHTIVSGIRLGSSVDADATFLNSSDATGDDTNGSDDENGVTFPTLTQGQTANITVNVSQATAGSGKLQGWIDWNGDGDFADAGEQIATNLTLASGTSGNINVPITVPANASGTTFARFRWSTTTSLNTTNTATDGEVEDYQITIVPAVTNQVPDTTNLSPASQINPGGTNTVQVPTLVGNDPEDGALGSGNSFKIVALPTNGVLYYNGTIISPGQTISNYDPTKLTIDPNNGALTVSFSYAAIDSAGLVDPTPATVSMPFTSATPITCPTGGLGTGSGYATSGSGQYLTKNSIYWLDWSCGATTSFNPGDIVTKTWTAPNGISITATLSEITKALTSYQVGSYFGDKLDDLYGGVNPIGLFNAQYGEDPNYKISFTMSLNGRPIPADIVTAEGESTDGPDESATWITDGDPWEVIEAAPNSSLDTRFSNGGKTLFMSDNPDRGFGSIVAMTENVSNINVQMNAGGKEAIAFGIMVPFDYGDAPASYGSAEHYARRDASGGSKPTTLTPANNLTMATLNFNTPYLGAIGPDPETVNQPTIGADGDQSNGVNDEDAFAISPDVSTSGTYSLNNIPVNNTTGSDTTLYAWIDFNKNGVFEANEFSSTTVANNATSANLSWTVPAGTTEGATYARFRITSDVLADNLATANVDERSTATAINGEVEDYRVNITLPNVLLVKRITAINGQTTTFNGTNLAAYQDDPANPYDDNIRQTPPPFPADTQNWPSLNTFMLGNTNGDFTRPNDELEYTIYFLSTGSAIAKNVLFCDRVPTNVSFIPSAFNSQPSATGGIIGSDRGILAQINGVTGAFSNIQDGDAAQYFPPGANPTSIYPNINCGGNNTNGAIVVNLGNLPNATAPATPTSSYGWVRFKSRVK
jgi:uncharacterized repeat protein (TIGR01451 family)